MNLEKFTDRAKGFLQSAQTVAIRMNHQRITPEHILKALLDDDQGLASNLIRKAGGSSERVNEAINTSIAKLPKVTGGDGSTYVDPSLVRVLDEAEAAHLFAVATRVAKAVQASFQPEGMTLLQTNKPAGWQTVPHVHVHVLPRHADDGVGLVWPRKDPPLADLQALAARIQL